jgi:hypothetical protein
MSKFSDTMDPVNEGYNANQKPNKNGVYAAGKIGLELCIKSIYQVIALQEIAIKVIRHAHVHRNLIYKKRKTQIDDGRRQRSASQYFDLFLLSFIRSREKTILTNLFVCDTKNLSLYAVQCFLKNICTYFIVP